MRWLANLIFRAVEGAWALVFVLVGRVFIAAPKDGAPGTPARVLVIAPHPDDETLGCGGAIATHIAAGHPVRVLVVTDGAGSKAGGLDREDMTRTRVREAATAVAALGVTGRDLQLLGLPEGRWSSRDLVAALKTALQDFRPTVVYSTSCVDFHPEHLKVAAALALALARAEEPRPRVRVYEAQVPLTPILANLLIRTGPEAAARKKRALSAYGTQQETLAYARRQSRYLRGLYGSRGEVEAFWELSAAKFCKVMRACMPEQAARRVVFRGLHPRPLLDGLAYVSGLRERLRLKQAGK